MAESPARRLDLRVGGKYRLGKKIGSGSFGTCDRYLTTFPLVHPLSRQHLSWDQHHLRGGGRHQTRVGQGQASPTGV